MTDTDTDVYGRTLEQIRDATIHSNVGARRRDALNQRRLRNSRILGNYQSPYGQGRRRPRTAGQQRRPRTVRQRRRAAPAVPQSAVPLQEVSAEPVQVAVAAEEQNLYKQLLNLLPLERQRQWNNLSDVEKAGLKDWCIQFDVDIPVAEVVPVPVEVPAGGRRKRRRKKRTKKKSRKKKRRTKKRRKKKRKTRR